MTNHPKRRCDWPSLNKDAQPIVWQTPYKVDGAPLPYTAAMLERRAQRLEARSQALFDALPGWAA